MMRLMLLLTLLFAIFPAWSEDAPAASKEKKWWEKRDERADIYYPHNAHLEVMKEEGDSCMLCHTFSKTDIVPEDKLKPLNTIANEPLKAICHNCHVDERRAPWRCTLCHNDKTKIWPDDHNHNYIKNHSEDGRRDENACRECHIDLAFCTNCHFRRDTSGTVNYHPLAYRTLHGMEARMMPSNCGRCHNANYCAECHEANR